MKTINTIKRSITPKIRALRSYPILFCKRCNKMREHFRSRGAGGFTTVCNECNEWHSEELDK